MAVDNPSSSVSNGDQIPNDEIPLPNDDDDTPEPFLETVKNSAREIRTCASNKVRRVFSIEYLLIRVPILAWLPRYRLPWLFNDFIAGFTVGLTAIPQGIAYAVVAGLSPEYGLYSSFTGAFVYVFLGSCKDVVIGPTAILALMTQPFVNQYSEDFAVLLSFLSGCIIILFSVLQLGFLVNFISRPVVAGFSTAAAIQIASSQLKGLFGLKGKATEFLPALENFFNNITDVKLGDSLLSLSTILLLVFLKWQIRFDRPGIHVYLRKFCWFASISRNAVAVLSGTLVAYILNINGIIPFELTGEVKSGFPPVGPPPFSTITKNNVTMSFGEMVQAYEVSIITVPFLSVLESIAISKALAKGKPINAEQELLALGVSNFVGSFFRSMPITGSFTRTVINNASGVKTTVSCLVTGLIVILALEELTGAFYFIPKASLSSLIVCAMFFMIEYEIIPQLWKTCKWDLIPWAVALFGGLFWSLEYGMILGIGINLIIILWPVAVPKIKIETHTISGYRIIVATPKSRVVYPGAESMWKKLLSIAAREDKEKLPIVLILNGTNLDMVDATVVENIRQLKASLDGVQKELILWNWQRSARFSCIGYDKKLKSLFKTSDSFQSLISALGQDSKTNNPA